MTSINMQQKDWIEVNGKQILLFLSDEDFVKLSFEEMEAVLQEEGSRPDTKLAKLKPLTDEQLLELRSLARIVVESVKSNKQYCDDTNSNSYQETPTGEELEFEYLNLLKLTIQIRHEGWKNIDYGDSGSDARMIGLEYSETLNFFNREPIDRSQKACIYINKEMVELEYTIDEVGHMSCEQLDAIYAKAKKQ